MFSFSKIRNSPPLDLRFGNVGVYCSPHLTIHFLVHGNYRQMKKSYISLVEFCPMNMLSDYFHTNFSEFRTARTFSNGESAIVVPSKYFN